MSGPESEQEKKIGAEYLAGSEVAKRLVVEEKS